MYEELDNFLDKDFFYMIFLKIDYKTIVSQTLSYTQRPLDLLKPSEIQNTWKKLEIEENDWVRLGYVEYELFGEKWGENKLKKIIKYLRVLFFLTD